MAASAASSPQDTKRYPAEVYGRGNCPEGTVEIRLQWRDSPQHDEGMLFLVSPPPVRACLELDGAPAPKKPFVIVRYVDGHYKLDKSK